MTRVSFSILLSWLPSTCHKSGCILSFRTITRAGTKFITESESSRFNRLVDGRRSKYESLNNLGEKTWKVLLLYCLELKIWNLTKICTSKWNVFYREIKGGDLSEILQFSWSRNPYKLKEKKIILCFIILERIIIIIIKLDYSVPSKYVRHTSFSTEN